MDNKKIVIASSLLVGIGLSVAYYMIYLRKPTLTQATFEKPVDVVTVSYNDADIPQQDDFEEYNDEPIQKEVSEGVIINGIIYLFNYDTYWYEDKNGNYYDPETNSLTIDDNTFYVSPNSVVYGAVDNNGSFTYV